MVHFMIILTFLFRLSSLVCDYNVKTTTKKQLIHYLLNQNIWNNVNQQGLSQINI